MIEADEALESVYDMDRIRAQADTAQRAYAHKMVKKLMERFHLDHARLLRDVKDVVGDGAQLSFNAFHANYPSFPVWLAYKKVPFVHETTIKDLFDGFSKWGPTKEWEAACEEAPDDTATGLVFDCPGVKGTQLILHNWLPPPSATVLLLKDPAEDGGYCFLEKYESFLRMIEDRWAPE